MARHLHIHVRVRDADFKEENVKRDEKGQFAYHQTKKSNLASIKKNGLQPMRIERKPGIPVRAWNKKDYNFILGDHPKGRLYFANEVSHAVGGALGGGGALLRVHKSHLPEKYSTYNDMPQEAQNNWFVNKSVKPEHIEVNRNGKWVPL